MKPKTTGLLEDSSVSTRGVIAFFAAAILGMAFIVLAKLSSLNQLQVTAIPIAILLIYAYILFRWRRLMLRDDQSGDNLYYLGFLYTLTSIAVSLYQFSINENAQEQIITNFGIAIATTILGLALRVMFNQMRQDPAEVERVARLELADAARRLRREIDATVVELNVFQRTAQQSLADNQRALEEKIGGTLDESAKSFVEASARMRSAFGENVDEFAKGAAALSSSTAIADKALAEFGERIEELRTSEVLLDQLKPTMRKVEALADELREAHQENAERLNAAVNSLDSAAGSMQRSARAIEELIDRRILEYRRPGIKRTFEWLMRRVQG